MTTPYDRFITVRVAELVKDGIPISIAILRARQEWESPTHDTSTNSLEREPASG